MRVIVAGGRYLVPLEGVVSPVIDELKRLGATEVVSGGARGGDRAGEIAAEMLHLPVKRFPADWGGVGKGAGLVRNQQMADYADALIALPGGRGTSDMKRRARAKGLKVVLVIP